MAKGITINFFPDAGQIANVSAFPCLSPVEKIDDINELDVRLHACITPSKTLSFLDFRLLLTEAMKRTQSPDNIQ